MTGSYSGMGYSAAIQKTRVDHYIKFIGVSRKAAPSVRASLKGFLQGPE